MSACADARSPSGQASTVSHLRLTPTRSCRPLLRQWRPSPTRSQLPRPLGLYLCDALLEQLTDPVIGGGAVQIAILGVGRVGWRVARLGYAAGHEVRFAARDAARPGALAAELGERAHAASVADAVAVAEVVLVAVRGPAVTEVLQAAGPLDGRVMIDGANSFGQQQLSLRSVADAFPSARWVRAFNSLSASIMADDNHRTPPWVMFLSGDAEAKPVVAQSIRHAGFDPVGRGGLDDSRLQDPDSALWLNILTHDEATALVAQVRSGDTAPADQSAPLPPAPDLAP